MNSAGMVASASSSKAQCPSLACAAMSAPAAARTARSRAGLSARGAVEAASDMSGAGSYIGGPRKRRQIGTAAFAAQGLFRLGLLLRPRQRIGRAEARADRALDGGGQAGIG